MYRPPSRQPWPPEDFRCNLQEFCRSRCCEQESTYIQCCTDLLLLRVDGGLRSLLHLVLSKARNLHEAWHFNHFPWSYGESVAGVLQSTRFATAFSHSVQASPETLACLQPPGIKKSPHVGASSLPLHQEPLTTALGNDKR